MPALPAFVDLRQTEAPAVLDHAGTLPQRNGRAGPAFDRRSVGRHRQLVVLDAGDVLPRCLPRQGSTYMRKVN